MKIHSVVLAIAVGFIAWAGALAMPAKHKVTVKFNYDFKYNPACSAQITERCVKQFIVYDISVGRRIRLFSIPAPDGANTLVKGITGTSNPLPLAPGKHRIAVAAQDEQGRESNPNVSTFIIDVRQ